MVKTKQAPGWRFTMRRREAATGYMFIFPWVVGMALFFLTNVIRAGRYAFYDINILVEEGGGYELIPRGLDHFRHALFVHPDYVRLLTNTIIDMLWNVPLIIFLSLFVAILLNRTFPGRTAVRAIFFLPVVLAVPGIQGAFNTMNTMMMGGMSAVPSEVGDALGGGFNPTGIAFMLFDFGVPIVFINYIVSAVARLHTVIRSGGVQMLIFLAALQSIPSSMYEVAQVEGATAYETFWKITLPMVSPLILTNVVFTIVDSFSRSAPVNLAFTTAFGQQNFGLSAAFSIISAFVICVFLLITGYLISRKVYYRT